MSRTPFELIQKDYVKLATSLAGGSKVRASPGVIPPLTLLPKSATPVLRHSGSRYRSSSASTWSAGNGVTVSP